MARRNPATNLTSDLVALPELSLGELRDRWAELYGSVCPPCLRPAVLRRALACRIQEQALGGLDRATRRRFDRAAALPAEYRTGA